MFKYRVQAIYNKFVTNEIEEQVEGTAISKTVPLVEIDSYLVDFDDERKDVAQRLAFEECERILRRGLTKRGGSIVRLVISPAAILQVTVIDMQKYEEEMSQQ